MKISFNRWVVILLAMRTRLSTNLLEVFTLGTLRMENSINLKDIKSILNDTCYGFVSVQVGKK